MKLTYTTNTFDETLATYGDISALFHFLGLNSGFTNVLTSIPAAQDFTVDSFVLPAEVQTASTTSTSTSFPITVMFKESLFDVATRYYGSVSSVISLMVDNSVIGTINDDLIGKTLIINNSNIYDKNVQYYNKFNSKLTTGVFATTLSGRAFNISWNLSFH